MSVRPLLILAPAGLAALAFLLAALAFLMAAPAFAKNTGVGDDASLQSGPCYEALVDKNEANPTTAPKRELGAACQAEDGDIDKAWARVQRLWGSDSTDLPDYGSYQRADAPAPGSTSRSVAALGVLLTYLALGMPMRSAARLFGAYPGPKRGAVAALALSLVLRVALGAAFLALFALPYMAAAGSLALIGAVAMRLARSPATKREPSDGSGAATVAEAINDALGAVWSLAALALFAQANLPLFALALVLAPIASTGPVILARRALRATPLRAALTSAALAAALGAMLVASAPVAGWLGGVTGAGLIGPLALAILTLAAGLAFVRPTARGGEA